MKTSKYKIIARSDSSTKKQVEFFHVLPPTQTDITKLHDIDVIVNASSQSLNIGGGVDIAVHNAAGPELFKAIKALPAKGTVRCRVGEVLSFPSFGLKKKGITRIYITAGPNLLNPDQKKHKEELIRACYLHAIQLAETEGMHSIAFPLISSGIFGYDVHQSAPVILSALKEYYESLPRDKAPIHIYFVCGTKGFDVYSAILKKLFK